MMRKYYNTSIRRLSSLSSSAVSNGIKEEEKGVLGRLWEKYSLKASINRTILSERLFRSAKHRANDKIWYTLGRLPYDFKSNHSLITMHTWFLHKRLIGANVNKHSAMLIQEELFDILWTDTSSRLRAEKVLEMRLNRHLKNMQQLSFVHCMHYDHAFTFDDERRRREELLRAVWLHVFHNKDDIPDDLVNRIAMYIEYQYDNIMNQLPEKYWREGRIGWGNFPDFDSIVDNNGKLLPAASKINDQIEVLPKGWALGLSQAGEKYYWNTDTDKVQWEKPKYF